MSNFQNTATTSSFSLNNNTTSDMFATDSFSGDKRGFVNLSFATSTDDEKGYEEATSLYKKIKYTTQEEEQKLKKMKADMTFKPQLEVTENVLSPLTALYVLCRDNEFPSEFLDSLHTLQNMNKSKLLGVTQMITQMKKGTMGTLDVEFIKSKESYGILTDELILRVNGLQDKPVQKIDSAHLLRWVVSRFTNKIAIQSHNDGAIFTLGNYCMQQFLDKKFEILDSSKYSDDYWASVRNLTKRLIDWTTWTSQDCESFTVGISSATSVPISVVHIKKPFYFMCVSLLNLVSLSFADDEIKINSLSSKVSPISTYFSYNKIMRTLIGYKDAALIVARILGTTQCYDKNLLSFSPLSYLLTYAQDRSTEGFEDKHRADYDAAKNAGYHTSLSFLSAGTTGEKANAYKNLKNIDSFYEIHANNRRYRSAVNFGIQEYDTTYFVGPFERTVRRSYYLNQHFQGYCYVGMGSGQDPRFFKSDQDSKTQKFFNIGVSDGMSSTQPYIELVREMKIPVTCHSAVIYGPIVRHEGVSALCKKMLDAGFKSVRMWEPDQAHSQFFPIEFRKDTAQGYNFNTAFGVFKSDTADTVLSVMMFNSMIRVVQAERDYMMRVQFGVDNIYHGKYVNINDIPEEVLSLTSGMVFEEVEFEEKPYSTLEY